MSVNKANSNFLLLGELRSSNKNTGNKNYMDGANVTNREVVQLLKGNCPHSGYCTLPKDENTATALWKGDITTVMAANGTNQASSFKGTCNYIAGTGEIEGIKGQVSITVNLNRKLVYPNLDRRLRS